MTPARAAAIGELADAAEEMLEFGSHDGPCDPSEFGCPRHRESFGIRSSRLDAAVKAFRISAPPNSMSPVESLEERISELEKALDLVRLRLEPASPPLAWRSGRYKGTVSVRTKSGGEYRLEPDGRIDGGSLNLRGAQLVGSYDRNSPGPIRSGELVLGERMRITDIDGRPVYTTEIVSVDEKIS